MKFSDYPKECDEKQEYYESSKEIIEIADNSMQKTLDDIAELPEFINSNLDAESHALGFIQGCKFSQQFWIRYYEDILKHSVKKIPDLLSKEFIMIRKQ